MGKIKEEKTQSVNARALAREYLKNASSGPRVVSGLCTGGRGMSNDQYGPDSSDPEESSASCLRDEA